MIDILGPHLNLLHDSDLWPYLLPWNHNLARMKVGMNYGTHLRAALATAVRSFVLTTLPEVFTRFKSSDNKCIATTSRIYQHN